MKSFVIITIVVGCIIGCIVGYNKTAYRDIEILKKEAPKFIAERGYKIVSYDGYEGSVIHGGFTYYQVRDSNDYLYSMAVGEWRGDLMIYGQKCLNAVVVNSK